MKLETSSNSSMPASQIEQKVRPFSSASTKPSELHRNSRPATTSYGHQPINGFCPGRPLTGILHKKERSKLASTQLYDTLTGKTALDRKEFII